MFRLCRVLTFLVCTLVIFGCEGKSSVSGGAASSRSPASLSAHPANEIHIFVGDDGSAAALLSPLAADPLACEWIKEKLQGLTGSGEERSFANLCIFNLGTSGDPALLLTSLGVRLELPSGHLESVPVLISGEGGAGETSSTVDYKALETFVGCEMEPGRSFESLVAFPGRLTMDEVKSAKLLVGDREVRLRPKMIPAGIYAQLLEGPERELLVAHLMEEAPVDRGKGSSESASDLDE